MNKTPEITLTPRWRRRVVALAVSWFVVCLLWTAPAALFATIAQRAAPIQLNAVTGSFWRGSAAQAYVLLPGGRFALGRLDWRLQPWSLLWLHPGAHITTDYGPQFLDTQLTLTPTGKIQLRNMRAAAPLSAFSHWFPTLASGLIALDLKNAELSRSGLRALEGEIAWQQANLLWNGRWLPLGDYRSHWQIADNGQLQGTVEGKGDLGAAGSVTVDLKQKNYSLQLQVMPNDKMPKELGEGLMAMLSAQRDAQGHLQVRRNGQW